MGTTKSRKSFTANLPPSLPEKTFIVDNGAYTMKAGYAAGFTRSEDESKALSLCAEIPNTIAKGRGNRIYIGSQLLDHAADWNELMFRRPVEKGYIVNWEAQRETWEYSFFDDRTVQSRSLLIDDPDGTTLMLTESPNALPSLQKNADEMVMEGWGFGGYLRCVGPALNAWNEIQSLFGDPAIQDTDSRASPTECVLVVDSGYSHTTVTPVYKGHPLQRGVRRLDIGGKHLTNYLKEIVSMRQYNMVDETYIMNEVKEAVAFVSCDFANDMERTWRGSRKRGQPDSGEGIVVDYVLPDPNADKKGFVRPHDPLLSAKKRKSIVSGISSETQLEDVLVLGNERFTVPEVLFTPSDIGMRQAGIPGIILQSLAVLPLGLHPVFFANILVVGGNSLIPGFMERLEMELRQIAPAECTVRVRSPKDPIRSTWLGGSRLAANRDELKKVAITRQEYQEYGSSWAWRKFSSVS